jgi:hypothetical protein
MRAAPFERALLAIAAITVASGAAQLVMPAFVLRVVGAEVTPTASHFFAIVGMFMVLFGGALWQAVRSPEPQPVALFWAGLQKFGAAAAVGLGVMHDIFSPLALGVASFDLVSGVLIIWYWSSQRAALRLPAVGVAP